MGEQDATVKDMMELALRSFLHVTGILGIADDAEAVKGERELVAPQKSADTLFRIVHPDRAAVYLFEFLARWNSRESLKIPERVVTIMPIKAYESLPIIVVVILLTDHDVPRELPEIMTHDRGPSGTWTKPTYVKAYELDPRRLRILPKVPLMREDPETMERAAGLVAPDPKLRAQFVILGSLRHDRDELRNLIERHNVSFVIVVGTGNPGRNPGKGSGEGQAASRPPHDTTPASQAVSRAGRFAGNPRHRDRRARRGRAAPVAGCPGRNGSTGGPVGRVVSSQRSLRCLSLKRRHQRDSIHIVRGTTPRKVVGGLGQPL